MGSAMKNHRYAIREDVYQEYWQVHKSFRPVLEFFVLHLCLLFPASQNKNGFINLWQTTHKKQISMV